MTSEPMWRAVSCFDTMNSKEEALECVHKKIENEKGYKVRGRVRRKSRGK